jgi:hypothetical protein
LLAVAGAAVLAPQTASAAGGGGGGGGSSKPVTYEVRVTGYITGMDSVNKTIQVGASYYGSGQVKVDSSSKISVGTATGSFSDLAVGQWAEVRYDYSTKIATKISIGASSI